MEDILASIRRILNEDEAPKSAAEPEHSHLPDDVLLLDDSMMVPEAAAPNETAPAEGTATGSDVFKAEAHSPESIKPEAKMPVPAQAHTDPLPTQEAILSDPSSMAFVPASSPASSNATSPDPTPSGELSAGTTSSGLVAPAAAAAASASVGELMRTLATERSTAIQRGGPTIEDLVRAEIRPLLKAWLDTHLPPVVERLVRTEIERVVGRMAP